MSNNNINDASKHQREMKTPIQEAIEKVQSLRQIDAVINPIGVIEYILSNMLEKEEETIKKCIVMGMEFIPVDPSRYEEDSELIFNKTFKTKER